ncbi:hypothetical protein SAY86_011823 [Trapa natans]|uniref:Kinesin motor domain-containing protein n=1 Tax=Trapa natans TaxID=22666 RepID=A0AAN7LYW7_TRANT|nr:hypothetical protein SAY86_011823 [Trapa natans]
MRSSSIGLRSSENRLNGGISSTSSIRSFLSRSVSSKNKSVSVNPKARKSFCENTPPLDPNLPETTGALVPPLKQEESSEISGFDCNGDMAMKSEKVITASNNKCEEPTTTDPAVKVVVRIRPANGGNHMIKKVSSNTLAVGDRNFTFDSVFDSRASQRDIFQAVGIPLVRDALAGYNASIMSYGQSGSGKTYTMWGPPSSMVAEPSSFSEEGLVPRIFQILFSEIEKQQAYKGKHVNYQCRCSFLEIYDEKVGDLLDPAQRNLQIKDDMKNGIYVENLTEEYVTTYEDVIQILIKGLSSRIVGATTMNSKSSRSHIVFTCIIESWCKEASSQCVSSSKTSRISLVDLAGPDISKVEDVSRACAREEKRLKKSLSHLGRIVNDLAEPSQVTNKDALYKGSKLTHLLQESIGGNAKLTVICAVSSDNKNDNEIMSTLRFGQRVKCVKNEPVINEITEEDMNSLSDQIRQLKEELIRAKCHGPNSSGSEQRWHYAQQNLNQLRMSLNRSLMLSDMECDSEKEINVHENDLKELHEQLDKIQTCEEHKDVLNERANANSIDEESCDSEDFTNCPEEFETDQDGLRQDLTLGNSISVDSLYPSQFIEEPTLSESPKISKLQRKSTIFSQSVLAGQKNESEYSKISHNISERSSLRQSHHIRSSLWTSMSLASSLQRGADIIECHQRSSVASNKSPVAFSFEHLTLKPSMEVIDKVDDIETLPEENRSVDGMPSSLICPSCQARVDSGEVEESLKTWIVPVKVQKDLMDDKKRAQELESICKEQAAKIEQLNRLVLDLKDTRGNQFLCIESSKNEISMLEEKKDEKINCDKAMQESRDIKEAQAEVEHENKTSYDSNEKKELLKEIQSLRSKLQQSTPDAVHNKLRSSLLRRSVQLQKSTAGSSLLYNHSDDEELKRERERWTEMESEWISLTDELRVDIETQRRRADKLEGELMLEKSCTAELDDALYRAILGHARMVEHYAELQEKHNGLIEKHRTIMEGIAEVKRAAAKAGAKGNGSRFAKLFTAELSAKRVEREKERELLKKENQRLRIQLKDTAEAVHAAGELLVRLREAEQTSSAAEENLAKLQEENEKLRKQTEKLKRKHKMEMTTVKQYLAESKLPGSALPPVYDYDSVHNTISHSDDDQAWRAEFGAIYQDPY